MAQFHETVYFESKTPGVADFPTQDGRWLRLNHPGSGGVKVRYQLTRLPSRTNLLPIDAVECRVWIADHEGCVWTAESCFTAEFLVAELAQVFFENARESYVVDETPKEVLNLFQNGLLVEGLNYSSDDRFYRSFRIKGEHVQAIFKYTSLVFDIALEQGDPTWPRLWARLRQPDSYDPMTDLTEIRNTYELPGIVFELTSSPQQMLYANDAILSTTGQWKMAPFPRAIVFERTNERADPQAGVLAVDSLTVFTGRQQLEAMPAPPPPINPFTGKPL